MLETMYDAPGIGLAAPQVGVGTRLIVMDCEKDEDAAARSMILFNPEIVWQSEARNTYEEGCLSIPDVRIDVERPATCLVRYVDRDGSQQELAADGLLATAIQHEVDHLDGRLIIDFLSRLRREMIIRKFRKQARAAS